ncbi:silicon efflux transporter LSI2-like [Carya illinoinensis]|uniref:Citrate transporter-like domain-containing protein n=1 Tax=Carya illinoinensis TaxID=32201 RepID=A0A8T1PZT4_CARIL|nr:silicon efflux transporter LSI2-like [Carya illinoinensis]XP_042983824.1 silicon efflux transporter LSI2-like [Carya illinoinensis]XP_042983825.1 silicon efflux transporter LSI2-like [Carya illinoinensis]XP_042983826.1 silicon efflux transporter LSI2-like [Carya illinoinensis]KAG6649845.1 hypothetical protein CIPAW_06G001500 [Carya illinoinensis]KAG6649846.1 hypothetical protein CIPAW_06G001500 [Carya illinoinensis]KAG6706822.1 hypothetical protein I3842_06G000800 [Carya illinoinensis]KAG
MALATSMNVVLGSLAFAIFWVLAVFPSVPFLPIGRIAGSLLGAMLMVIFRIITPDQAYNAIDLSVLGHLFGTMLVNVYLERADMFKYLGKFLSWKSKGAKDLIFRICLISAISSALFTNDTACIVLIEVVLKIARQHSLPPHPFLLALASSANIGSSATPIGNPQNLVIAVQSKISFRNFLMGILPAMLLGVVANSVILICMYWRLLSIPKDEEDAAIKHHKEDDLNSHPFSPATMLRCTSSSSQECNSTMEAINEQSPPNINENMDTTSHNAALEERLTYAFSGESSEGNEDLPLGSKRMLWKSCVYLVTIGMLIAFLMGLNMLWTAITAALALVVLDFKDARLCLEKVSYLLLIFFCGMFITIHGFDKTGIPGTLWELMEPYAQIDRVSGIAVLAIIILILSNLASNVPTVLLLGAKVTASAANEKKAWLILAWVSTTAGNLSLLGSTANIIVCEQASQAPHLGYNLSFWSHLKFGVPSTLIVTAIGLTLIR